MVLLWIAAPSTDADGRQYTTFLYVNIPTFLYVYIPTFLYIYWHNAIRCVLRSGAPSSKICIVKIYISKICISKICIVKIYIVKIYIVKIYIVKIYIVIPMKVYGKLCTITHAHSPLAWNLLDVLLFPRVSYPLCMRHGRDTVRLCKLINQRKTAWLQKYSAASE